MNMLGSKFDHLSISSKKNVKFSDWNVNNFLFFFLKKNFLSLSVTQKILSRLIGKLNSYRGTIEAEKKFFKSLKNLSLNSPRSHMFASDYGYEDDIRELNTAIKYKSQIENGVDKFPSESSKLYKYIEKEVSALFLKDPNIKHFVNMGVSYAYIDSILASKNPSVHFLGIDRSKFTKLFNEIHFSHFKNIEFIAEDIFSFLKSRRFDGGVFFHTRTLLLLSKSFIEELYRAVADAGFKYIVGMEQVGISRQTLKPYQFSEDDKESVVFRSFMFIHNYPGILKKSGFQISKIELVKTDHPHEDFRMLSFTASREVPS